MEKFVAKKIVCAFVKFVEIECAFAKFVEKFIAKKMYESCTSPEPVILTYLPSKYWYILFRGFSEFDGIFLYFSAIVGAIVGDIDRFFDYL